ncbi:hypothetical protein KJY73_15200 [Bowmanella sp. Y26]|uniref:hypothetical protein n=1 Tax=Bowmanella yangjiangensis TaxID=2811230 RepID=UPI001BDD6E89|nr:hypothetical protein [Bowmanella yangjiangensis]MBT1064939.1 hypothetical protein [Bowmanella yangjiangensis]
MPRFFLPAVLLFFTWSTVCAADQASIDISSLQGYQLSYATAESVTQVQGSPVLGQVTFQPGSAYEVSLPFAVMQHTRLVHDGAWVTKGQPVAKVQGREVEHFFDEYQAAKRLFEVAERNYQANLAERAKGIVSSPQWLTLEREYHAASLNWEHVRHLRSLLVVDELGLAAVLSPIDGVLEFSQETGARAGDAPLFSVVDKAAVQLQVMLPHTSIAGLTGFSAADVACDFTLQSVTGRLQGLKQQTWSSLAPPCQVALGQTLRVRPIYQRQSYSVPLSAVFELDNQDYVAVREQTRLRLVSVKVRQSNTQGLLVDAGQSLDGKVVLSSSVSALQGLLIGLGKE